MDTIKHTREVVNMSIFQSTIKIVRRGSERKAKGELFTGGLLQKENSRKKCAQMSFPLMKVKIKKLIFFLNMYSK
jgi:hypothetical protein